MTVMWVMITLLLKLENFCIKSVSESMFCVSRNFSVYMSCFKTQVRTALRSGPNSPLLLFPPQD